MSLILFAWLVSQFSSPETLQVEVSNIGSDTGYIMIAAYDSDETFLSQNVVGTAKCKARQGVVMCPLVLPFGEYAISVYHDENGNGELDTNLFRIPKEPTGFSNNAEAFMGPPDFAKVLIKFDQVGQKIQISLE